MQRASWPPYIVSHFLLSSFPPLLPPFQHRANVAASDACRLALQHVPTLADPAGLASNTDALPALLQAVGDMSLGDRKAVQHALRHAQRAQRRLEGKRRRLRGMVTDNHRQVARIISALVGDQGVAPVGAGVTPPACLSPLLVPTFFFPSSPARCRTRRGAREVVPDEPPKLGPSGLGWAELDPSATSLLPPPR